MLAANVDLSVGHRHTLLLLPGLWSQQERLASRRALKLPTSSCLMQCG